MGKSNGLRVAVTGAAGFIGRAVVERIAHGALGDIALLRLNDVQAFAHPNAEIVLGSYADVEVRDRLVAGGIDVLFHLASLPGGAAARDTALGKTVNLDGSINLLDAAAAASGTTNAPVVVYASSIAALGVGSQAVNDATALRPAGSYGTHKAMIEFYLADLTRRGLVNGRSVRLAGIVARPSEAYAGFATAWMSDLFHAAINQRDIKIPVRPTAHVWLQSIEIAADNIIRAALIPSSELSPHRVWTLPATVVRIESLIDALHRRTGYALKVDYGTEPNDHPPLDASAALALGFTSDGNTDSLVDAVVSRLERAVER